jgi:signal transduction histidine kinase
MAEASGKPCHELEPRASVQAVTRVITEQASKHFRQEPSNTTKPGGLGLGLSICQSIIEAHNGQLWASLNVPRGAIFRFTAPAPPAAAS